MWGLGTDHVISGPNRGLKKNCIRWRKHTHTDRLTDIVTQRLNLPANSVKSKPCPNGRTMHYILFTPKDGTVFQYIWSEGPQYMWKRQVVWPPDIGAGQGRTQLLMVRQDSIGQYRVQGMTVHYSTGQYSTTLLMVGKDTFIQLTLHICSFRNRAQILLTQ